MRHLKANESIHDNLARDAAIAEMGRRLAAQAIRTRRRQSGHFPAGRGLGEDGGGNAGQGPRPVTREDALPASRPLPAAAPAPAPAPAPLAAGPGPGMPWARVISAMRQATLLGATAACGFSVVLYGEHLRVTAGRHHGPPAAEAAREPAVLAAEIAAVPAPPPPQAIAMSVPETPVPVIEETLAASILAPPPTELRVAELGAPPAQSVAASILLAEAPARPVLPMAAPLQPPIPVAAPAPSAPPRLAYALPHAKRVVTLVPRLLAPLLARASPRPSLPPHVTLARFELPRWLTERPAPPATPRIMSEPPHNLVPPEARSPAPAATQAAAPEPAPRPQRPRVTYALASPYPSPYAYPYYAAPYAYKLPPLRRPAFYTAPAPSPEDDREEGPDQP